MATVSIADRRCKATTNFSGGSVKGESLLWKPHDRNGRARPRKTVCQVRSLSHQQMECAQVVETVGKCVGEGSPSLKVAYPKELGELS